MKLPLELQVLVLASCATPADLHNFISSSPTILHVFKANANAILHSVVIRHALGPHLISYATIIAGYRALGLKENCRINDPRWDHYLHPVDDASVYDNGGAAFLARKPKPVSPENRRMVMSLAKVFNQTDVLARICFDRIMQWHATSFAAGNGMRKAGSAPASVCEMTRIRRALMAFDVFSWGCFSSPTYTTGYSFLQDLPPWQVEEVRCMATFLIDLCRLITRPSLLYIRDRIRGYRHVERDWGPEYVTYSRMSHCSRPQFLFPPWALGNGGYEWMINFTRRGLDGVHGLLRFPKRELRNAWRENEQKRGVYLQNYLLSGYYEAADSGNPGEKEGGRFLRDMDACDRLMYRYLDREDEWLERKESAANPNWSWIVSGHGEDLIAEAQLRTWMRRTNRENVFATFGHVFWDRRRLEEMGYLATQGRRSSTYDPVREKFSQSHMLLSGNWRHELDDEMGWHWNVDLGEKIFVRTELREVCDEFWVGGRGGGGGMEGECAWEKEWERGVDPVLVSYVQEE